jgi:hypothetical protein
MLVAPLVIDLGWGDLKSALAKLPPSAFAKPSESAAQRRALMTLYRAAFRKVEAGAHGEARAALKGLAQRLSGWLTAEAQAELIKLVDAQSAKLP